MSERPAGWYDDPENPQMLRYWDGVLWTPHTVTRDGATPAPSAGGPAAAQVPTQDAPRDPWAPADTVSPVSSGSTPYGAQPYGSPAYGQGQQPSYPQQTPYGAAPYGSAGATTTDGVPLAGWWRRVLAFIVDSILTYVIALPFTTPVVNRGMPAFEAWFREIVDGASNNSSTVPALPEEAVTAFGQAGLIYAAIRVLYEVLMLAWRAQTVGRMATNTSVRLVDRPGIPGIVPIVIRTLIKWVSNLLGAVSMIGGLLQIFTLVDYLWPLWDKRKQALHDKAASTQVVMGKQPPRG